MEARVLELTPEQVRQKVLAVHWEIVKSEYRLRGYPPAPLGAEYFSAELKRFWAGQIEELRDWWNFNWIADTIEGLLRWFWDTIIKPGIDLIIAGLGWVWETIKNLVIGALRAALRVGEWLWNGIRGAVSFVWDAVQGVLSFLSDVIKAILDGIMNVVGGIWEFLKGIGAVIAEAVRGFFEWIWSGIQSVLATIWEGLQWVWNRIMEGVRALINTVLAAVSAVGDVLKGILETLWDWLKGIFSAIAEVLKKIGEWIWSGIKWLAEALWKNIIQPILAGLEWLARKFWDLIFGPLMGMKPARPEGSILRFTTLWGGLLVLKFKWKTIARGIDAIHPFKRLGASSLVRDMIVLGGLAAFGHTIYTTIYDAAVKKPLHYDCLATWQPTMPGLKDVILAVSTERISKPAARRFYRYQGYGPEFDHWWEFFARTPVRYFALRAIAAGGYYSRDVFETDMVRTGYPPKVRDLLHLMYLSEMAMRVERPVIAKVLARYEKGFIRTHDFHHELKGFSIPHTMYPFYDHAARLLRDFEMRKLGSDALTLAYRRAKIEDQDFLRGLDELGVDPQVAQLWLRRERTRRKEDLYQTPEEEVRAYGRATVIRRYREGVIDEAGFRSEMETLGYTPPQIERFLVLARLEYDYDYAMDQLRIAQATYRVGLIGDEEFLDWLSDIPIGRERAEAYLLRERIRRFKKRPREVRKGAE